MIDITSPEFEMVVGDLFKLARGDFNLVEEAVLESMLFHPIRYPWWKFWLWFAEPTGTWSVDLDKAIQHIKSRRTALEAIEPGDDLNK